MDAKYVQRGESIDFLNTGEAVITAGTVVELGSRAGVAGCDMPPGAVGSIHTVGVFTVPKADADTAIDVGDDLFYTEDGVDTTGTVSLGWAVAPSAAGDAFVTVKL